MKKNTILKVLLVFLIVVNGFFLYNYMVKDKGVRPKEPQRNKNFIVKELGFNAEQLEQFNKKSVGHHETMIRLSDDIKVLKDKFFGALSNDTLQEESIDSISSLICEKEKQKDREVYSHFKMIKDIANSKQKEKFNAIIMDALHQGDQGGNRPPPNGNEGRRPFPDDDKGHRPPPRLE